MSRASAFVLSAFLGAVIAVGVLAGCGSSSSAEGDAATKTSATDASPFTRVEIMKTFSAHGLPLLESVEPKQPSPVELLLTPAEDNAPRFQLVLFKSSADARRWAKDTDELADVLSIPAYEAPTRRANMILFFDGRTAPDAQRRILAALNDV